MSSDQQPLGNLEEQKLSQRQAVGDVVVSGDDNTTNIVQGKIVTIDQSQKKIIQVSVDEIKTREFVSTSPYKGLRRFEAEDKDRFFGRSQFLAGLETELAETNFVLLLGASGSGKSSVVRAGLIPRLSEKWGTQWVNVMFTPDRDPFESLYGSLLGRFKQSEAQIVRHGQEETLTKLVESLKEPDSFWFIFIDQFEELFTTTDTDERDLFIKSLTQLCKKIADDRTVKIMATMRSDFLDRFDAEPANKLAQISAKHRPLITQMQADELREVIEQPAAHHGVVFEEGLVETIIKEVQGQAGYLPLLQYTLARLWQSEVEDGGINDRTLNTQSYRNLGGVRGALQQRIEGIYQALSDSEKLATQRIFLRLVGIGGDSATAAEWKPVRKREARSRFSDETEQTVLDRLIDANLLVSSAPVEGSESASMVEIAHEILLTSWRQLRIWIRENREAIAFRNRLNEDVERWKIEKPDDELWSGSKLAKAVDLKNDPAFTQVLGGFSEEAIAFIKDSVELRDRAAQEKEAKRQKELAQERKARETAQRVTMGVLMGGLVLAGAVVFSAFQMRYAEIQQIQTYIALSKGELANNRSLNADIASIRAARTLQKSFGQKLVPSSQLRLSVLGQLLQTSVNGQEQNRLEGHQRLVWALEFSPDGKKIVTRGAYDETTRLWDLSGKLLAILDEGHQAQVVFSPNSKQLGIIVKDGTVQLWNSDGSLLTTIEGHQGLISTLEFSPDGKQLVTGGEDGTARLWDSNGHLLATLAGHQVNVRALGFSPDGNQLATLGEDGTARLWDSKLVPDGKEDTAHLWDSRGKLLATLENEQVNVRILEFSDDKQFVTIEEDGIARLWDDGNPLAILEGHKGAVRQVEFSPDGKQLVTLGEDGTARLWDSNGNPLAILEGHKGAVQQVELSPDGKQLVTLGDDDKARLWDSNGNPLATIGSRQGDVYSVMFSPEGKQLATKGIDGIVHLWDSNGNSSGLLEGHKGDFQEVVFSPDGKQLATGGEDGAVRLWDVNGKPLTILKGHKGHIWEVGFSPDGKQFATGGEDGIVRLWDNNGKPLSTLKGHQGRVWEVVFNPSGKQLATGGEDGIVRLWDNNGKLLTTLEGHQGHVLAVRFSPDGKQLATGGEDGRVRLWDNNGNLLSILEGHPRGFPAVLRFGPKVRFSPDGKQLVTLGEDDKAFLWNRNGNLLTTLEGHQEAVWAVRFSPDGKQLATGGEDGIVRLWDRNGNLLATLEGHQEAVWAVGFSPDGKQLVTGGEDRTARLWDRNGRLLTTLEGHQRAVWAVGFSPDGKQLVTGGEDRTARLWDRNGRLLATLEGHQLYVSALEFSPDGKQLATRASDGRAHLWLVDGIDELLSRQCDWVRDYLTNSNSPSITERDRNLCDGIPEPPKS